MRASFAWLLGWGALFGLAGCTAADSDTEDVGETDDTQVEEDPYCDLEPCFVAMTVDARVGWDAAAGTFVDWSYDDGTGPVNEHSRLIVRFVTDEYYGDDGLTEDTCTMELEATDPIGVGTWDAGTDAFHRFESPAGVLNNIDCDNAMMFEASRWGDDVLAMVRDTTWGAAFTPISQPVSDKFQGAADANPDEDWETEVKPYLLGGGFYSSFLAGDTYYPDGFVHGGFTFGWTAESGTAFAITSDTPRVTAADASDGTVPSGVYRIESLGYVRVGGM